MTGPATAVSVLMPVAAPAPYLAEALASVTAQTLEDWELVLVLDGPDDAENSVRRAARSAVPAQRLVLVELPERRGVAGALNAGLAAARGTWIARLDADDRADPARLATQSGWLADHPEVGLLGHAARLIDGAGEAIGVRSVLSGPDLRAPLLARNRFVHSSVMFPRRLVLDLGGYDVRCHLREDYELWLRIARRATVANLGDPLVDYRLHPGQVTRSRPTAESLRLVARAQAGLARTLGVGCPAAVARRTAWRAGQSGAGQRLLALRGAGGLR